MNSKIIKFWLFEKGKLQGNLYQIDKAPLQQIPVKLLQQEEQNGVIKIVDKILTITKAEDYLQNPQKQARVKELEREIARMVYQLYGLTKEEIRIVEGDETHTSSFGHRLN